jgi:3alpha(or 20beta)-hydroxysteroid dehydrogenase
LSAATCWWNRVVSTTGSFLGIQAVTPSLRRAGGGSILNIVSTMANVGTACFAPHTAAKWAVRGPDPDRRAGPGS